MTISESLKDLAAWMGFHVVRNRHNPTHTLMGLRNYDFGMVFDVGANRGQFARTIRRTFPHAIFYCFEPTPAAFEQLSIWASTQERVVPVQLALGARPGILEMNVHKMHDTSSSLLSTTAHCETLWPITAAQSIITVQIERLDDYVNMLSLPLVGEILLKLDVQGYEAEVLRGAPQLLAQVRACIVEISLDQLYEGQCRFADIFELMTSAGLQYAGNFDQYYGTDGHVIYLDAMFTRDAPTLQSPFP
jgi:FkbM family methyltransferase